MLSVAHYKGWFSNYSGALALAVQQAVHLGQEITHPSPDHRCWGSDIQSWIKYAESIGYQLPSEFESLRDTSSYDTVRTFHLLVLLYVGILYPYFATGCMCKSLADLADVFHSEHVHNPLSLPIEFFFSSWPFSQLSIGRQWQKSMT